MYFDLFMIGLFVAVLQNLLPTSDAVISALRRCKRPRMFKTTKIMDDVKNTLVKGNVTCTAVKTVYEIRYSNGLLCACGLVPMYRRTQFVCQNQLAMNFAVNASTHKVKRKGGEKCDFTLEYLKVDRPVYGVQVTMQSSKPKVVARTSVVKGTSIVADFATSWDIVTTTVSSSSSTMPTVGQIFATSSSHVGQSASSIYPMAPETIISVVAHYSAVTIGYGSPNDATLLQTTSPTPDLHESIPSTAVLATSPLPSQPVLQTSFKESGFLFKTTTAMIQASPTTSDRISPSSTLSSTTEQERKFNEDIEFISNFNASRIDINDKATEKTIKRVLDAAANLIGTNQTVEAEQEDPGMKAVNVLQDLGDSISRQLDLGNESSVTYQQFTKDLVFGAAIINVTASSGFSFPSKKEEINGDEEIVIPNSVFKSNSGKAYFVGIIFKAYREMRDNTGNEGFLLGTKVLNAVVSPPPSDNLKDPVEMMFEKNLNVKNIRTNCSFWIENTSRTGEYGRWSTNQCFTTFENESHVKCECHHFTNFAVLFKIDGKPIPKEDSFRLVIITYIGLSLSIIGCFLTFIIYVSLRNVKSDRAIIHTNLVCALGIADAIFLVAVAVKPVKDSCLATAMLAFYFYLAVFFWMLVEGVYIYLMVIKVFRGNVVKRRRVAYVVGWGCPLIIAIATWAVLRDDVVSKYHCWLSVESGAIWAFVGPGLFIILVNCIIVLAVVRTTWATFVDDKNFDGVKSATKTFGAVIPILGITWVFGVMAFNESAIAFQYIFAITNSIQGALIFVLYCLVNKEVRNELQRRFEIWHTRREMASSAASRRQYVVNTHSAQKSHDFYQCEPNEMKEKPPVEEHSSLLDDITPEIPEQSTQVSELSTFASGNIENGGVAVGYNAETSPVKDIL